MKVKNKIGIKIVSVLNPKKFGPSRPSLSHRRLRPRAGDLLLEQFVLIPPVNAAGRRGRALQSLLLPLLQLAPVHARVQLLQGGQPLLAGIVRGALADLLIFCHGLGLIAWSGRAKS